MKFIKICSCLIFLMGLGGGKVWGQQWLWVETGYCPNTNDGSYPNGIAVAPQGNIVAVGAIHGSVTFGFTTISTASPSVGDPLIINYSSTGNVIWAITGKANAGAAIAAVSTNAVGEIYVTGSYADTLTFGTLSVKTNYIFNTFIAKFDQAGNILWMKSCNPTENQNAGSAIAVDRAGNIIVTGYYSDSISFGQFHLPGISYAYNNAFVVKFDSNGNILWANSGMATGSSTNGIFSESVTADSLDNVYIAGTMQGSGVFGTFSLPVGRTAFSNTFIAKYDSNGNIQWATGSNIQGGGATGWRDATLTCDIYNSIYLSGTSGDTVMFGNDSLLSGGAFLVKYSPSGSVIWAKSAVQVSQLGSTEGYNLSADKWGHIYWCGEISEYDTCIIGGMQFENWGTYIQPCFMVKMDTSGRTLCGVMKGFSIDGGFYSIAADKVGPNVYWAGNIVGFDTSSFGTYHINVDGDPTSILIKWTCDTCSIPLSISSTSTTICQGQNSVLYANGSTGYIWSNGGTNDSTVVSPDISTTYSVFAGNGNCSGISTIKINVNPNPTPNIIFNNRICSGMSDTITVSGGSIYLWSNGDTSSAIIVSPISNTNYTISISNGLCSINDSVNVQVYPYPVPGITGEQFICSGQSATISASGGSIYLWNTGDTTSSISISPLINSTYSVTISNGVCAVKDSVTLMINPGPLINVCCDSSITHGESVQLISSGGGRYSWSPATALSCDTCPNPIATPTVNITYTLTIVSDSGCVSTRTVTIDVSCGNVFIPTAFSPNQLVNSILYVRGPCIASMDFCVFDRWGNKVFESQNQDEGWDGSYKGKPMNMGTYVWFLKATMQDGASIEKNGNVTLVR